MKVGATGGASKVLRLASVGAYSPFSGDAAAEARARDLEVGLRLSRRAIGPRLLGNSGLISGSPRPEDIRRPKRVGFPLVDLGTATRAVRERRTPNLDKKLEHVPQGWESASRGGLRVLKTETHPETRSTDGHVARVAWALRQAARPVHPSLSTSHCGWTQLGEVGISERSERCGGGFTLSSISTCGSVWDCPVCAMGIKGRRAEQIRDGVRLHRERYGHGSLALNTFTVRHNSGQSLEEMADGIQRAWFRFKNRSPSNTKLLRLRRKHENAKRLRAGLPQLPQVPTMFEEAGYIGGVYGQESTHGKNGWHLHRHEVAAFDHELTEEERLNFEQQARVWWAECVLLEMGEDYVPTERGFSCDQLHRTDYISKLGLEVADVGTKVARGQNRNQWQILADAARGDVESVLLFGEYSARMRGRKCIQFSDKLRDMWLSMGMQQLPDSDVELLEDPAARLVLEVPRDVWGWLRRDMRLADAMVSRSKTELFCQLEACCFRRGEWGSGNVVLLEAENDERRERAAIMFDSRVARGDPREVAFSRFRSWLRATLAQTEKATLFEGRPV